MLNHVVTGGRVTATKAYPNHRRLMSAGVGAVLALALMGTMPAALFAQEQDQPVEGSWYITINVENPSPATFDALYGFARGGVFTRIDGRNNAPALGSWKQTDDGGIVFSAILFNFTAGDTPSPTSRNGAILVKLTARVLDDGTLSGTFTAEGILGLSDFYRSGSFTGTRIAAQGP
jgi:hypothetical protein